MPDWSYEDKYTGLIAGIDEAGRGPWAGPVAAGAVVFLTRDLNQDLLSGLNDSKKLSAKKREYLYSILEEEQHHKKLYFAFALASASEIDEMNILQATFLAMRRAVQKLPCVPRIALVDGNRTPGDFICPVQTIVKGDSLSMSVAAASIIAKVGRDRIMSALAEKYPWYGFEKNAGYGTKLHIEGLKEHGITPEHRKSYKPIADVINGVF